MFLDEAPPLDPSGAFTTTSLLNLRQERPPGGGSVGGRSGVVGGGAKSGAGVGGSWQCTGDVVVLHLYSTGTYSVLEEGWRCTSTVLVLVLC